MEHFLWILIAFAVIGSVGNFIAFCFYLRKKSSIPHIFIRALALTDFITCVLIIPLTIWMEYKQFEVDSNFLCKVYRFFSSSNIPFAAILMAPIALDRYFSICKPFSKGVTKKMAYIIIIATALLSMFFGTIIAVDSEVSDLPAYIPQEGQGNRTIVNNNNKDAKVFQNSDFANYQNTTVDILENPVYAKTVKKCINRLDLFSNDFMLIFQKLYACVYAVSVLVTLSLYTVMYVDVVLWRKKRFKLFTIHSPKSSKSEESSLPLETVDAGINDSQTSKRSKLRTKNCSSRKSAAYSESFRMNIRLAVMLFSISFVFILAYLPAWLMIFDIIELNLIIFYMHFCYNVIHPFTFVTMDRAFRAAVWSELNCKGMETVSRNETERSLYS